MDYSDLVLQIATDANLTIFSKELFHQQSAINNIINSLEILCAFVNNIVDEHNWLLNAQRFTEVYKGLVKDAKGMCAKEESCAKKESKEDETQPMKDVPKEENVSTQAADKYETQKVRKNR